MNTPHDTIVAIATPPGRGSVGILRVSGPLTADITQKILHELPEVRRAYYGNFYAANAEVLDTGLAIYFKAPHSFTGEDITEFHAHGGPIILDRLLKAILAAGARPAEPGEFSKRAFLNDKIDLAQAEAIADLISAESTQAARSALRSLQGEFSKQIQDLLEALIYLRMYVEAAIDFPEEEVDFLGDQVITEKLGFLLAAVTQILKTATQGALLREGIQVVIAGKPNAGKSSLLNALSGQERAIVTELPGTTRDILKEQIQLEGLPLHIIDTAGLRATDDPIEQEGIRRAWQAIDAADLILWVVDASEPSESQDFRAAWPEYFANTQARAPVIVIYNKIDQISLEPRLEDQAVYLSAKFSQGLDLLAKKIRMMVGAQENTEGIFMARRRHVEALEQTLQHLRTGQEKLEHDRAGELLAEELRLAQEALSCILGKFTSDDLLGRIFSSFCIGK